MLDDELTLALEEVEQPDLAVRAAEAVVLLDAHHRQVPPRGVERVGLLGVLLLARQQLPCIDAEARNYFRDVQDHVARVESRIGGLRDALSAVFEVSSLLEQQRVGTITKRLAAWAAILAVPTAIAGIYGMNFQYMPELHARYGYFVVLGLIIVICLWLYDRFRKTGWL